jgi:hypothetical protein
VIALDKGVLLGMMGITDLHLDPNILAETHKGGGKITALRTADESSGSRSMVTASGKPWVRKLSATASRAVSAVRVGANLGTEEQRGAHIDHIAGFQHMLLLAIRIGRGTGNILKIELPMRQRGRPFHGLRLGRFALGDALVALEDLVNGARRGRASQ